MKTGAINQPSAIDKPYVIMVSLDGFRHDYPTLHGATHLLDMMANGSYVERLIPSFPSKTFPNHYTLATGMYPANHGLIGNQFFSREKQMNYRLGNPSVVTDGRWYGGIPLWSLAEQQGMLSASFFWVGSEAKIHGQHPAYYFRYDGSVPYQLRIDQVQHWLELPESERPHLIFLYYSLTDSAGHAFGPESPDTGKAVKYVDALIGDLRTYIQASDLPINLIVTADHGMTEITENINIRDYADLGESQFISGPMAMIYTKSEEETSRIYSKLQNHANFDCYLQDAVPSYLNFSNKDRVGDIVLITSPPLNLNYWTGAKAKVYRGKGTHGYDPYRNEDMNAIFIAEGPQIRRGQVLSPLENIHVYPFVASILELEIDHTIDGRKEMLAPLLKQ